MTKFIWQEHQLFGSPDLLAAAGAVIAGWNYCEVTIEAMLAGMMQPKEAGKAAFHCSNNSGRLEMLREIGNAIGGEFAPLMNEFVTQLSICVENRNLIAHAAFINHWDGEGNSVLRKQAKGNPQRINTFSVNADEMAEIANSCFLTAQFGLGISMWIWSQQHGPIPGGRTALPDTPPRPRKLNPLPQPNPDSAPDPQQSSQG
jgi:hypothetical protein